MANAKDTALLATLEAALADLEGVETFRLPARLAYLIGAAREPLRQLVTELAQHATQENA